MTEPKKSISPAPQGDYSPASRVGNIIYTAGMTPRYNGELIHSGKVNAIEPIDTYKPAVRQATENALTAAQNTLEKHEYLIQILSFTVYINTDGKFQNHSRLADFASEYLKEAMERGSLSSRTTVGVASLPGNAPVEVQLVAASSS